jgi:hypothetical protein
MDFVEEGYQNNTSEFLGDELADNANQAEKYFLAMAAGVFKWLEFGSM